MSAAPLRVLIADDEPPARANIRSLLRDDPAVELVGEARDGREAVELIRSTRPDVVLLDVQMPGLDGFEVVEAVGPAAMPCVVFVTAHDEFAVRAFEASAVDYLVKPYSETRLRESLERVAQRLTRGADEPAIRRLLDELGRGEDSSYLARLVVRDGECTRLIDVESIDWIEADDYYAGIHVGEAVHLVRQSLATLERRLDPAHFVRIHRSSIVNLARVRELSPWSGGSYAVVLHDGTRLTLSRRRRATLESALGQSL